MNEATRIVDGIEYVVVWPYSDYEPAPQPEPRATYGRGRGQHERILDAIRMGFTSASQLRDHLNLNASVAQYCLDVLYKAGTIDRDELPPNRYSRGRMRHVYRLKEQA